jgi:hypothetical protein
MKTYKGFDKDMKCQGFQFKEGEEYSLPDGKKPECCKIGFHACENPLDTLRYYGPCGNKFHEVDQSGDLDKATDDTKIASSKIKIGAEINLKSMIDLGIKFIFEKIKNIKSGYSSPSATSGDSSPSATSGDYSHSATSGYSSPSATSGDYSHSATSGYSSHSATSGDYSHSATSGYYSPSATSGDYSHSATSGDSSPSATSGDYSHSATSGDSSHSATSGDYSHSATSGKNSIACAIGREAKAKTTKGNWLVLSEYDSDCNVKSVKTIKVDGKKIKADTWYVLRNGKFVIAK